MESSELSEQILLDENLLALDLEFCNVGDIEVSPCHQYLAYTIDTIGDECYKLYIKNLNNNLTYNLNIDNISSDIIWSADSNNILYLKLNDSMRPYMVCTFDFHNYINLNNTKSKPDSKLSYSIFTEPDERFELWEGLPICA